MIAPQHCTLGVQISETQCGLFPPKIAGISTPLSPCAAFARYKAELVFLLAAWNFPPETEPHSSLTRPCCTANLGAYRVISTERACGQNTIIQIKDVKEELGPDSFAEMFSCIVQCSCKNSDLNSSFTYKFQKSCFLHRPHLWR